MLKKTTGVKGFIVIVVLLTLILGYFYYLSNRTFTQRENVVVLTPLQEVTTLNFDIKYPPTPREVVKTYLDITKVLYNENLTDEEIREAAMKLREIFDDELAANNGVENYISSIHAEIADFKSNNYKITDYYTSSSTDVEEYTMDGFKLAKLYGVQTVRTDTGNKKNTNVFILRKDDKGRWKIYGFKPSEME